MRNRYLQYVEDVTDDDVQHFNTEARQREAAKPVPTEEELAAIAAYSIPARFPMAE